MTDERDHSDICDLFVALALEAGEIITRTSPATLTVERKSDDTPVTRADREAESIIVKGLQNAFPHLSIVAEERSEKTGLPKSLTERFFLVDALDGTKEFIRGRPDFTVNIALVENGSPIIGVVYAPRHNRLFAGRPGKAAVSDTADSRMLGWKALHARSPADPPCIVASRSHRTAMTDAYIGRFKDAAFRAFGSSLKFCFLAMGEADIYPRFSRTMEWDTAAGDAVLRAAGGHVVTLDGEALCYGKIGQADGSDFANPPFIAFGAGPIEPDHLKIAGS